jgi:hypothetical protein
MSPRQSTASVVLRCRLHFSDHDHHPSPRHWAALEDIARAMQDMANGICAPKVWLFGCDPGCGKTQTVAHFARALVASEVHREVGLVATQQRIEMQCRGASFEGASQFHYRGKPSRPSVGRSLAAGCRDLPEPIRPSAPRHRFYGDLATLSRRDPWPWAEAEPPQRAGLLKPLRAKFPDMTDAIECLFIRLRNVPDGADLPIQDWQHDYGVGLHDSLGADTFQPDDRATLTSLFVLSGRVARVRHDGPTTGNAVLTYEDTLPTDLAPLLVLDASGRVKNTYADTATKDYSPLAVNVWQTAGSKSGWQRKRAELVEGIASPDSDFDTPGSQCARACHDQARRCRAFRRRAHKLRQLPPSPRAWRRPGC